jgi:hypothetical protein
MSDDAIEPVHVPVPETSQQTSQSSQQSLQQSDQEESLEGSFELLSATDKYPEVRFHWKFPSSELQDRKPEIYESLRRWKEHTLGDIFQYEDRSNMASEV